MRGRALAHGKASGLIFDGFGDFDGFLFTKCGEESYFSRERDMRDLVERGMARAPAHNRLERRARH